MQQVIKDKHGKKIGYIERVNSSVRVKDERGHLVKIISSNNSRGGRRSGF